MGLRHPHIVRTLRSGEEDGALYLAMAYVDGSDLRELLRREGSSRLDGHPTVIGSSPRARARVST